MKPKTTPKMPTEKMPTAKLKRAGHSAEHHKVNFPRLPLEEAMRIPAAIKEKNGGEPWDTAMVAKAMEMARTTPKFFYLVASSRDFGLTIGSRDTATISLSDFGREVVYAGTPEQEALKKRDAFLRVDLFRNVLEHYKGSNLPEMKYLGNVLKAKFGLPEEKHDEFSKIFRANCDYLGISAGFTTDRPGGATDQAIKAQIDSGPNVVVLADPGKPSAPTAFVIMPFVEKTDVYRAGFFQEVLNNLITPAAKEAGFIVKTANRKGSDVIQATIINELASADLVIADLTEHNPNVLFELGIRIAQEKPVALIKTKETGRIFDVDNIMRVHEYNSCLWSSTLEKDRPALKDHIAATWENKAKDRSYMKVLQQAAGT